MKTTMKLYAVLAFVITAMSTNAQDVMILRNGDEVNVKVTEVGVELVKYKRTDNPDGPAYEQRKSEVFMIKYANGAKDVFTTNTSTSVSSTTMGNTAPPSGIDKYKPIQSDYEKYMRMYNRRKVSGTICTSIGVPFVVLGVSLLAGGISANELYYARNYNNSYYTNYNYYGDHGTGAITAGSIFLAAGIPLTIVGAVKLGTSNKYLRKALEARPTLSFAPSVEPIKPVGNFGGSAMGLAMHVTF